MAASCVTKGGGVECPLLADCRYVSAVDGDNSFEDVSGGLVAISVGDDVHGVFGSSPCCADVEAASRGGAADELEADGDGVALVAVFGGGIAEANMVTDVLDR